MVKVFNTKIFRWGALIIILLMALFLLLAILVGTTPVVDSPELVG